MSHPLHDAHGNQIPLVLYAVLAGLALMLAFVLLWSALRSPSGAAVPSAVPAVSGLPVSGPATGR